MTGLVDGVVGFVAQHTTMAYGVIFLISLSEALPVIGTVLPGSVILVALATLIPSGILALWPSLTSALLGAILGDGLSYWLGHHYRERLLRIWPFSRSATLTESGAAAFAAHGIKAIFIGRFTPARSIVPMAAGIAGMPAGRFYAANVASALAWAPAHILPGALLGATVSLLGAVAGRLAALVVGLVLVCCCVIWATRFLARRLAPGLTRAQAWLWRGAQRPVVPTMVRRLLDPRRPDTWLTLPLLITIGLGLWLGTAVIGDVPGRSGADTALTNLGATLRTGWANAILGDVALVLGLATCITALVGLAWSVARGAWCTLACWAGGVIVVLAIGGLGHEGPWLGVLGQQAGAVAITLGLLTMVCAREAGPHLGALLTTIGATAVAFSLLINVYFGLDPLSDLLTGLAVALMAAGIFGLALMASRSERLGAAPLSIIVLLLASAGGVAVSAAGADYAGPTRHEPASRTLPYAAWWADAWSELPARRVDLGDEDEQPLTFQWAASVPELAAALAADGWSPPVAWSWRTALAWLDANATAVSLPVLPVLHAGRAPIVTLARPDPACTPRPCRLVMRLWIADVSVAAANKSTTPLLVGTVVREHFTRLVPLLTIASAEADMNGPRDAAAHAVAAGRVEHRKGMVPSSTWDGRVLLGPGPRLPSGGS